jgi:endonuclease YncB( thermonuclease family)
MRKHLSLSLAFILVSAVAAFAQMTSPGEVVEVIDGRTVIVKIPTGKVRVELQYIDVPEVGQPMQTTMRDHLSALILGKTVLFRPVMFIAGRTIGGLMLKDVDVSQQMLRDGAAWHVPQNISGQTKEDFDKYSAVEAAAKQEKRGVWSIAGMQPAWEFRAARLAESRQQNTSASSSNRLMPKSSSRPKQKGYWGDENPKLGDVGALAHGFNAATRTGYVTTTMLGINEIEKTQSRDQKTAMEIAYWYKEDETKGRTGSFIVTVVSSAPTARFLTNNDLYLQTEKPILLGKAKRIARTDGVIVEEKLTYQLPRSTIESFVNATVNLRINNYAIRPSSFAYTTLHRMLQISTPVQTAKNVKPTKSR